ncbi:glycosyltransferase [Thomasclavelia sp.]|uniref:glycosyltransferase n=1 Tax=Thomasclavelia sp. TaxID=3025757 RepID=UPI0025D4130F|nr:glycosyltransferase [Thomasclavelia sp.]
MKKKILIMMSTYNGEKYINKQVDSILNQKTCLAINLLIRDDGSTDNTPDILKEYASQYKNIEIVLDRNIGCNRSFFKLIQLAKDFDYYAFSDQDDIWLENKIQSAINEIDKLDSNIPILYGSSSYIMKNEISTGKETRKKIRPINFYNTIIQNFLPGHSQVMNRAMIDILKQSKNINFDKIYMYDYWICNVAAIFGNIIFDNNSHTLYRMHDQNVLGYGNNKINWTINRLKKVRKGELTKQAIQINYFYEYYNDQLSNEQKDEIENFLKAKKIFYKRINYALSSKFYRQSKLETLLFKLLYIFKQYNI